MSKIMIVDDNPIDQMITAQVLRTSYDYEEIMIMESVQDAIEYLDANQENLKVIPSLILLDLDMPDMNGFDFLNHFNNYASSMKDVCRIVVLTASEVANDIEQMEADPNVSRLIMKPLGKNALMPVI